MERANNKMAALDVDRLNCKRHVSEEIDSRRDELNLSISSDNRYLKKHNYEIVSLKILVEELHKVFSSEYVNVEYVTQLMMNYKSNPADWKKYAKFDRFRYTRNLVDAGNGAFNVMVLCWGGGHASAIHDHADSHCFMKILAGELEEVRYSWPEAPSPEPKNKKRACNCTTSTSISDKMTSCMLTDYCDNTNYSKSESTSGESSGSGSEDDSCSCSSTSAGFPCDSQSEDPSDEGVDVCGMVETGRSKLETDDVCYINDTLGLHRVENPSHATGAVSLHLYCPPFDACSVFDARTGRATKAQVTFWSMYGSRRNRDIQDSRAPEDN